MNLTWKRTLRTASSERFLAIRDGKDLAAVDLHYLTNGTVAGTVNLVEQLGATVVGISFLAELPVLGGRKRLPDGIVSAIIAF